jgi:ethanolamine utilization microcompartment shell protein EutL
MRKHRPVIFSAMHLIRKAVLADTIRLIQQLQQKKQVLGLRIFKVRPTERYKFIVDEATYKALPIDTIATSQYDYSFHAGEGIVTSWIMAIGKDQAEVKSKLDDALKKVKVQYVGSETELKYAQKRAVGR